MTHGQIKQFAFINAVVNGHVLAILAVILNAFAANGLTVAQAGVNKVGVVLAVLGIVAAYIQQTLVFNGAGNTYRGERIVIGLTIFTIVAVAASYLSWLSASF